jgi:GAF domain-containing protein
VEVNHRAQSGFFTPASSALSIPLFDASGVLFAVLSLYAQGAAAFTREDLRILESAQPGLATALQNALTLEKKSTSAQTVAADAWKMEPVQSSALRKAAAALHGVDRP